MIAKAFIIVAAFTISVLITPSASQAQHRGHVPRVGYLGTSSASLEPELVKAFQEGLREHGYVEGQNIVIEYRWAEGNYQRFPDLVADLVKLKVDLILTAGTPGALAAKRATQTTLSSWQARVTLSRRGWSPASPGQVATSRDSP